MTESGKKYYLSVFTLTMICVATVMSLRGLPMMASEGLHMFFYIFFSAFFFLVPVSLVCAELATGWPHATGIYGWVKEAFGEDVGFIAVWLQWSANVVWYPTILSFAAGALSYLFLDTSLASNRYFTIAVILIIYWGSTFINLGGLKLAGKITTLGVILGTIIPGIFIIVLGIVWMLLGNPIEVLKHGVTGVGNFIPDFSDFNTISALAAIVFLFSGMEVGAVHVKELKNPKKDYPRAVFGAMFLIIIIYAIAAFSVAAVMPLSSIIKDLNAGLMQGFHDLFAKFGIIWLLPIMGFFITFGAVACVVAWVAGPSKGVLAAADDGNVPQFFRKKNKNGIAVNILIIQGSMVSLISLIFLIMPTVSSAYFILAMMTAAPYLIMYGMLYVAAIRLRYTQPDVERTYKLPWGNFGMWLISGIGILAVTFAFILEFFPPKQLPVGGPLFYVLFLGIGTAVFVIIPFIIIRLKKSEWKTVSDSRKDN